MTLFPRDITSPGGIVGLWRCHCRCSFWVRAVSPRHQGLTAQALPGLLPPAPPRTIRRTQPGPVPAVRQSQVARMMPRPNHHHCRPPVPRMTVKCCPPIHLMARAVRTRPETRGHLQQPEPQMNHLPADRLPGPAATLPPCPPSRPHGSRSCWPATTVWPVTGATARWWGRLSSTSAPATTVSPEQRRCWPNAS